MLVKRLCAGAFLALAIFGAPESADAVTFGGTYSVSANKRDPGLVISTSTSGSSFSQDLQLGESVTFGLFDIWTNETYVNAGEDTRALPISVSFGIPDFGAEATITGVTKGNIGPFQHGSVKWDEPIQLALNDGNMLTIGLSSVNFNMGFLALDDGHGYGSTVRATISYGAGEVAPVPLPASLPLLLASLFGLGYFMRRRQRVAEAFA